MGTATALKVDHAEGCPAQRIERYQATRPDGAFVTVERCIDCGSQDVRDGLLRDVTERKNRKENNG